MFKWILRVGYIAFFILAGYFVLWPITTSQMFESFLNDHQEEVLEDPLFVTNALVNQQIGTQTSLIIRREPMFSFVEENNGYGIEFYIFSAYDTRSDTELFILLIQNVRIPEAKDNDHISFNLNIDVSFDHTIKDHENPDILRDEVKATINTNLRYPSESNKSPNIAYITKKSLIHNDNEELYANVILFNISYTLFDNNNEVLPEAVSDRNLVSFYDEARLAVSQKHRFSVDKFPDVDKTFDIATEKMNIRQQYLDEQLFIDDVLNPNYLSQKNNLEPYNSYIFRNFSIFILVGLVGGYFLFVHRKVIEHFKKKKFQAEKQ